MLIEKNSSFWDRIHGSLIPLLERNFLRTLSEEHKTLIRTLELLRIEETVKQPVAETGRPAQEWVVLCRAFIAKAVLGLPTTRSLIDRLTVDDNLARICGWKSSAFVPHESTFSRVFAKLADLRLPEWVHHVLTTKVFGSEIIENSAIDASAIKGRERSISKPPKEVAPPKKRGRKKKSEPEVSVATTDVDPESLPALKRYVGMSPDEILEELPKDCDFGTKKNSQGKREIWKGFKLHIHSAEGDIPLACVVTSASLHDSQATPSLIKKTAERTTVLYTRTDAAYDAKAIKTLIHDMGGVPIIDPNPRNSKEGKLPMEPDRARRYKKRSGAERIFSRLKDEFGVMMIRVRGHKKVTAHIMFSVLALTADQIFRLGQP